LFGRELKEALLDAAQEVGEVEEIEVLDADGKPTGMTRMRATDGDAVFGAGP